MTYLYHGSVYKQDELMPGFQRSGKLVEWDKTESNRFLYATTDYQESIRQALAALLENKYQVKHYRSNSKTIDVTLENPNTKVQEKELDTLNVFIYTIYLDSHDGWIKNNNLSNHIVTEYKTECIITNNIEKRDEVNIGKWLKDNRIKLRINDHPYWTQWK